MYTPPKFQPQSQAQVIDFVKDNGFAIVCSTHKARPWATHIPLILTKNEAGEAVLQGHVSKGNQQWKSIEGQEVLCIFQGPHAYISSSWYDHVNVPTWNYVAVHIYGYARLMNETELLDSLHTLVDKYEAPSECPFSVDQLPPKMLKNELRGIVGIEIKVSDIEASFKLSQNRDAHNQGLIMEKLNEIGNDNAKGIGEWIEKEATD